MKVGREQRQRIEELIAGKAAKVVGVAVPAGPFAVILDVTVPGIPKSRGSKRAIVNRHTGKPALVDSCKGSKDWMGDVKRYAADAFAGVPEPGPLALTLEFTFPRPKSHYRTGRRAGELRPDAPEWHTTTPDMDKRERGTQDALKGVVFIDDSQVAEKHSTKRYGPRPGVRVVVRRAGR